MPEHDSHFVPRAAGGGEFESTAGDLVGLALAGGGGDEGLAGARTHGVEAFDAEAGGSQGTDDVEGAGPLGEGDGNR